MNPVLHWLTQPLNLTPTATKTTATTTTLTMITMTTTTTKTTIVATAAEGTVQEMGLSLEFLPFHRLHENNTRFSRLLRPSQ